ncbi:MAG: response regulator [Erythrobacter sp.]
MSTMAPRPRLLYIDDDEAFARLLTRNLDRLGFDVVHAGDGKSGFDQLSNEKFDVVALDHYMPGLSGEQTLARIVAMPEPPPVVYVTASDECQVAVSALKSGASDYVIKDMGAGFFELLAAILWQAIGSAGLKQAKQAAQAEAEAARERAELLLKEVNHRVANSLTLVVSMAHLQAGSMAGGEAREVMEDFATRVNAIAQVHKRLYTSQDISTVELEGYLSPLVRDLHQGVSNRFSLKRITFECAPVSVNIDKAISIGVILSELITNAGKYAYPGDMSGEVRVEVLASNGRATLAVEDDGVGLSENGPSGTGLGSQMVAALASSLDGKLEHKPREQGTRAELSFPAVC